MIKPTDWLVGDMDDGILRVAPTRRAAVQWCKGFFGPDVLDRYTYGSGSYSYTFGYRGEDHAASVYVGQAQWAVHHRFDLDQVPLYPLADDPFERVER